MADEFQSHKSKTQSITCTVSLCSPPIAPSVTLYIYVRCLCSPLVNGANIDVGIIDATTCVDDANGFVVPLVAEIQYRLSFIVLLLMLFMLLLIYL